ncbi:MAG TPA: GNAT family N-acetyltransferase [Candidatus Limiplasma sp.]|nr:GNAT family N-acetyltransferase [Candidatus Limiplasma sp.]HRX08298.1 GNAT family N-acetyltransferase [Candidatus Limiplasma sp.]
MSANAELQFTDGRDEHFAALCRELDETLNVLVGGEEQRAHYKQFNTLDPIHDVVLVLEAGQPVACGGYKLYEPGTAEIKRVFCKPEYQGRGYGRAVIIALEQRAAAQGYTRLILETGNMLEAAMKLYASLGFTRIENYGQYRCMPKSVCMEKRLDTTL